MIFGNLGLQSTSFITKAGFETSCKSSFRIVVIIRTLTVFDLLFRIWPRPCKVSCKPVEAANPEVAAVLLF